MSWTEQAKEFLEDIGIPAAGIIILLGLGICALLVIGIVWWIIGLIWWMGIAALFLGILHIAGLWTFNVWHAIALGFGVKILKSIFSRGTVYNYSSSKN